MTGGRSEEFFEDEDAMDIDDQEVGCVGPIAWRQGMIEQQQLASRLVSLHLVVILIE